MSVHSQTSPTKLDSLFRLLEMNHKFMGTVALMKDGQITYSQAFGLAEVAKKIPAVPSTLYQIGSVTKTFTAVMILQLFDEGRLSLDDKLEKYFPGIDGAQQVTIEQMLRHKSGLFSLTNDTAYINFYTQPQTRQQLLNRIMAYRLQFTPGEKFEYSNTNYILLGWLLEDLEGMSYAQLLQQRIAKPLGLKHTFATNPESGFAASSYTWNGKEWTPEPFTTMMVPGGAGNIFSTAEELLIFYHALFSGKLISEASLSRMKELKDNFGMGVFAMPFYEYMGLGHTGGIDGFRSVALYFPEEQLGAAVCSNALNYNQNEILVAMLNQAFGRPWQLPVIEQRAVEVNLLEKYAGTYAAEGFPLKLTIRLRNGQLFGQGTGQPEFPLEARSDDTFAFDSAGISITFRDDKLHLKQGTFQIEMSREQ
jgi:CubicO group peptidase (beta-lactamase class C family)